MNCYNKLAINAKIKVNCNIASNTIKSRLKI